MSAPLKFMFPTWNPLTVILPVLTVPVLAVTKFPAMCTLPATPVPPFTINAPVVLEVEVVVLLNINCPNCTLPGVPAVITFDTTVVLSK